MTPGVEDPSRRLPMKEDTEMAKKLTVFFPGMQEARRDALYRAAKARGFETAFPQSREELGPELPDTEIFFGYGGSYLKGAPRLRWFCSFSAGVEGYLDPDFFASRQVLLSNSSGAYGVTIAEHIVMVTLELMRRRQEYAEIVARREWVRDLPIRSIHGSRVTLLGTGDIGREAAKRLRAFGPKRIVGISRSGVAPEGLFDRVSGIDALDEILPETDLLVLSLPETPETRDLLSGNRLALLPEGAFLVNVGRGSALDQDALEAMLRSGRLGGAALDVFREEPIPPESALWTCPRLLITPHISGNVTLDYTAGRIVELFLEDFENYCDGRPLKRRVHPEKGY